MLPRPPLRNVARPLVIAAALTCVLVHAPALAALPSTNRSPAPRGASLVDITRRLDGNRANLVVTNLGSFGFDLINANAGLVWPRGSGLTSVFASGLWLGGRVSGEVRMAVAEYAMEYSPGPMIGALPAPPDHPHHGVYKMARWSGSPADSEYVERSAAELAADPQLDPVLHHSWAAYREGAAPYGAPMRLYRLPVTTTPDPTDSVDVPGPDVLGDQMLWCVYNDADPALHTSVPGSTLPLGIEVQQTAFSFDRADELGDVVFLRFQLVNKGGQTIDDFHASLWSDPDLGGFTDDLVGSDVTRRLGYAYNAVQPDLLYGTPPPAVAYALLRGLAPAPPGLPLGMTAFTKYINGTDPNSALEALNHMQGLNPDGSDVIDPVSGLPTRYMVSGDPVSQTGWLDVSPADRRFLMSSGPVTFAPGDSQVVWLAIAMARGSDRLASVGAARCVTDLASEAFLQGFAPPLPSPAVPCSIAVAHAIESCPRPADYWSVECLAGGAEIPLAQLDAVAAFVDARSTLFDWTGGPLTAFCGTLNPVGAPDLRQQARREFATFLANYSGNQVHLPVGGTDRIQLHPGAPVSCPPLTATTLEELAATANLQPGLLDARYLNNDLTNRRPIQGVDVGIGFFNGGAGLGELFFGSSLSAAAHPDSFQSVEIRFSTTARQGVHRLLRMEKTDGSAPAVGRGYLYGGFFECDFQVWDVVHDVQLDAIFVERYLVDDSGTPLPDTATTIPSLDRRWAPTAEPLGGREYLFITSRPYSGAPRDEFRVDGEVANGTLPVLYALWAMLRVPSDVFDDGDAFLFEWGRPPNPGADLLLYDLEQASLADPAVQQAYSDLIACLSAVNSGLGIGPVCPSVPTSTLVSLIEATAGDGRVTLRWYSDAGAPAMVERRVPGEAWRTLGLAAANGSHELVFEDRDVVAGGTYDYRLALALDGGIAYFGEARVELASVTRLALLGSRLEPGAGRLVVRLSLAGRAPARLELLDIAGRRVLARELSGLEPGEQVIALEGSARLPSGIYLLRLEQAGRRANGKAAVIR